MVSSSSIGSPGDAVLGPAEFERARFHVVVQVERDFRGLGGATRGGAMWHRLLLFALVAVQSAAVAQEQTFLDDRARRKVADEIEKTGARCPEVRDVKYVGSDDAGNVL